METTGFEPWFVHEPMGYQLNYPGWNALPHRKQNTSIKYYKHHLQKNLSITSINGFSQEMIFVYISTT